MKLKALCSAVVLCFVANVFAMNSDSQKDPTLNSKKFGQLTPVNQANLENLSREELLKVIADLQQQIKTHESVLAEIVGDNVIGKALKNKRMDTISFLLDNGANLEKLQNRLRDELYTCAIFGRVDMFEFLLEKGADPNGLNTDGDSLLITALRQCNTPKQGNEAKIAKLLLYHDNKSTGKKLIPFTLYDTPNKKGETPLMFAVWVPLSDSDRLEIINLLLEKGAKVNRTDREGISALKIAREIKASEEIIKLLEDAGATEGQEIRDVRIAEHNDIQSWTDNGKSPTVALYEFCQRYSLSDLKFDYVRNNKGEFNYVLEIDGEKFSQDTFYKSKKDAKNAIAAYVLYVLRLRYSVTDNKNPVVKLNEYLRDNRMLSSYSQWYYEDGGTYNSIIKIGDKEYNLDLHCKSRKEAENTIAEHVYNVLIKEEAIAGLFNAGTLPQASSSGTNQQSSSVVNGNTTAGLPDSSGRRTSVASDNSDSDNSDSSYISVIRYGPQGELISSDSSDSDSSDSDSSISDNSDKTMM